MGMLEVIAALAVLSVVVCIVLFTQSAKNKDDDR
jgi:hypothetical protein